MNQAPHDDRLNDLETRFTFLDDAVNSLNDSEAHQSQRLLQLENALAELRRELSALRTGLAGDARDEPPPPHY